MLLDAGGSASTRTDSQLFTQYTSTGVPPRVVPGLSSTISGRAPSTAAYAQATWNAADRASVSAGVRFAKFGLIDEAAGSPWAMVAISIAPGTRLQAGASMQRQSPDVIHVSGLNGNPQVHSERSRLLDGGVEHAQGAWRFAVQAYQRRDEDFLRLTEAESRLVGTRLVLRTLTGRFFNSLSGTTRGVETTVERRSAQGCGGWASYTYGRSRVTDSLQQRDVLGGLRPAAHLQQLSVPVSPRRAGASAPSCGWAATSPFPAIWRASITSPFRATSTSTCRSRSRETTVRLPQYQRLDLNVSRAFLFSKRRLTLFAEAMNATGRINLRANAGSHPHGDRSGRGVHGVATAPDSGGGPPC